MNPAVQSRLILASGSPRRLELLRQIGIEPDAIEASCVDEQPLRRELPLDHARRLALEKAVAVAGRHPAAFVLAADTVVACGRRLLPKAEDLETARACLRLLSGRRHRVVGGVCVIDPAGRRRVRSVTTAVTFKRLAMDEMEDYLRSGEWEGKAGGYAIQGRAAVFVRAVNGSYSNVVGLPLFETHAMLCGMGYRP
jgi:septum formation protein